jgi:hypothetical protein
MDVSRHFSFTSASLGFFPLIRSDHAWRFLSCSGGVFIFRYDFSDSIVEYDCCAFVCLFGLLSAGTSVAAAAVAVAVCSLGSGRVSLKVTFPRGILFP